MFVGECIPNLETLISDKGLYSEFNRCDVSGVGECVPDLEKLLYDNAIYGTLSLAAVMFQVLVNISLTWRSCCLTRFSPLSLTAMMFQVFLGECIPDLEKLLCD